MFWLLTTVTFKFHENIFNLENLGSILGEPKSVKTNRGENLNLVISVWTTELPTLLQVDELIWMIISL